MRKEYAMPKKKEKREEKPRYFYELRLQVPEYPPSLNGDNGLLRAHWTTRREWAEQWEAIVWYALTDEQRSIFDNRRFVDCTLTMERHTTSARGLDWTNCAGSLKIPEDVFVKLGILKDDNPTVVKEIKFIQKVGVKKGGFTGTIFSIVGFMEEYDKEAHLQQQLEKRKRKKDGE
jgi:hypothetical protein